MQKVVMTRCPPGDRWADVDRPGEVIAENLTAALAHVARTKGKKEFFISAIKGEVCVEDGAPEPPKDYVSSLYEELL